jgi:voltage-gated potassium channel Kch
MANAPTRESSAASGRARAGKLSLALRRDRLRNRRMMVLLLMLVTGIFVIPAILPEGTLFRLLSDATIALVLISGVMAIADHRKLAIALACLALLVIAVRWAEWFVPAGELQAVRHASTLSACLLLAFAVGINVFAPGRSISDRIFGAVVLYLLIGLIAAFAYSALYRIDPGAFSKLPAGTGDIDDWLYFSFVTLTTVGYGDITPIARSARAIAMLEALVGQLFPAIIIARFVSLRGDSSK